MKIAIVHDELIRRGGGEQVALCLHKAFPQAPIFTMVYQPHLTYAEFRECIIKPSWFQKLAQNERVLKRLFFPFGILAMKQLDVSDYDVILMSSTYCAKYVKIRKDALVINYCHSPFRLAWYPESYKVYINSFGVKKFLLRTVIHILKWIDFNAALRTDFFIANATEMASKIKSAYKPINDIQVINPPVEVSNFFVSDRIEDYYLVVGRLEYYKRVDIVVEAFNELGQPLIIVGKGSQEEFLMSKANKNITFKKEISTTDLAMLYSKCKALIFPQLEDYGIAPLEANASGRPVIAFGKGGVLETMIPHIDPKHRASALFFNEQTPQSLMDAVRKFETIEFDPKFIRSRAEQFDTPIFVEKIKEFVLKIANQKF